jgi:hypothetical protein
MNSNRLDVVNVVYSAYNRNLSLSAAAQELGMNEKTFKKLLDAEPYKTEWSGLSRANGYIKKDEFNALFGSALNEKRDVFISVKPLLGDYFVTQKCMAIDPVFMTGCFNPSR